MKHRFGDLGMLHQKYERERPPARRDHHDCCITGCSCEARVSYEGNWLCVAHFSESMDMAKQLAGQVDEADHAQ